MTRTHSSGLSRRAFCLCCLASGGFAATSGLSPRQAFAEARGLVSLIKDSAATSPIVAHKLRNNISALEGSGGNIAVLTGPDGKVLVDAGIGVSRPQLSKALTDLSPEPVATLINTHWHFDHTDGNTWLNSVGAKIIAQDNTRKYLGEVQRVEDWDYNFLPPAPGGMPTETFADALDLKLNGVSLELKLYAPAHTDSDISVNFAEANVVHVNLAAATADTIIIAGHGQPVSNKSELKEFRDMLVGVRENVATLKRQGRSRDEIVAAKPTAAYDAKFGAFVIDPGFFTRLVYEGV
jgi:glyoxylase-like metal-dependent hydrolase (beta-lactamase superfamily II)